MNKALCFLMALLVFISCAKIESEYIQVEESPLNPQIATMPVRSFESKESLREAIKQGEAPQTKGSEKIVSNSVFTAIKNVDIQNDPVLSYECSRRGIIDYTSKVDLYELLAYDELVPNEKFASLLNPRGEICVGNTMYKISPRGTYYFPASKREEFERNYAYYERQTGKEVAKDTYMMDPEIFRFDTFKDDPDIAQLASYQVCLSEIAATKATPSFPSFAWSNYPTYSGDVNSHFRNQVFTYSLPNNRRVRTKIYHNDYVVYDERGATLKCQKSGLGWSAVVSKALMLTWKNIILQSEYGAGEPRPYANTPVSCFSETVSYMGANERMMTINQFVLSDAQVNSVVAGGMPALRSILLNAHNIDINGCKIVMLRGVNYYQIVYAGSWHVGDVNIKESKMALSEQWLGRTAKPLGGQFWYQALDDNNSLGALRVGTAF